MFNPTSTPTPPAPLVRGECPYASVCSSPEKGRPGGVKKRRFAASGMVPADLTINLTNSVCRPAPYFELDFPALLSVVRQGFELGRPGLGHTGL